MQSNIQILFRQISLANIEGYLTKHGWFRSAASASDVASFERTGGGDEGPSRLWINQPDDHPRFRNRVPNLIFTLALLENREALDIANEMALCVPAAAPPSTAGAAGASGPATATAAASATGPRGVVVENRRLTDAYVGVTGFGGVRIPNGKRVAIVDEGAPNLARLTLTDEGLGIATGASPRYFLGPVGVAASSGPPDLRTLLVTTIEQARQNGADIESLTDLEPLIARMQFELGDEWSDTTRPAQLVRRHAAMLAATLARQILPLPANVQLTYDLAAQILALANVLLPTGEVTAASFFALASGDDPASPQRSLGWLKQNSLVV